MDQSPCWESVSSPPSQEITPVLTETQSHERAQKSPPLAPVVIHILPVHTPYFSLVH